MLVTTFPKLLLILLLMARQFLSFEQVKIRGQRVDLLEVEAHLRAITGVETAAGKIADSKITYVSVNLLLTVAPISFSCVHSAVAMLDSGHAAEPIAAAYVVPPAAADGPKLRAALAAKVAPYSVPSLFLGVSKLPLLASGKLDRAVLKRPLSDPSNPAHETVQDSLRTVTEEGISYTAVNSIAGIEQCVAKIWQSLGLVGPFTGLPISQNGETKNTGCLSFYVCGGDSLRLVSLTSKLRSALRRDITLLQLAALPDKTVPAMARLVASAPNLDATRGADLAGIISEESSSQLVARYEAYADTILGPVQAHWVEEVGYLSYMQQGMLFHCLMHGSAEASMANLEHNAEQSGAWTSMYVQQSMFELEGELDLPRFRRAWATLLYRHELLRSYADPDFLLNVDGDLTEDNGATGSRPVLVTIASSAIALPLKVVDLWETTTQADDEGRRLSQLDDMLESERQRGIGIGGLQSITISSHEVGKLSRLEAPLFRLLLVRVGAASWRLSVVIHHLITDGWSLDILFKELSDVYSADVNGESDENDKADLVVPTWQALVAWEIAMNLPGSESLAASEIYWRNLLSLWHPQEPLQYLNSIPEETPKQVIEGESSDLPEVPEQLQVELTQVSERLVLGDKLLESIHEVARKNDLTVNALMHGAWALLQAHVQALERERGGEGGGTDEARSSSKDGTDAVGEVVVYGCTSSGRSAPVDGVEALVGPVIKTFPVVVNVGCVITAGDTLGDGIGDSGDGADLPFTDLAASIHMQLFRSMEHEALPLAQMHRLLPKFSSRRSDIGCDASQLFYTILNFEPDVESVVLDQEAPDHRPKLVLRQLHSSDRVGYPLTLRAAVSSAENGNAPRISLLMTAESSGSAATESAFLKRGPQLIQLLSTYVALLQRICEAPHTGTRALRKWLLEHGEVMSNPPAQLRVPIELPSQSIGAEEESSDWFPLTPVQRWFFGLRLAQPNHFNQTILLRNENAEPVDVACLNAVLRIVVRRHSALRHRYSRMGPHGSLPDVVVKSTDPLKLSPELKLRKNMLIKSEWVQRIAPVEEALSQTGLVQEFDISSAGSAHSTIAATTLEVQKSVDIETGPLLRCALVRAQGNDSTRVETIALVVHHLAMDGVSQRVLIDELTQAYDALRSKPRNTTDSDVAAATATLAPPPPSFKQWCLYALGAVVPQLRSKPQVASWPNAVPTCKLRPNSGEEAELWDQNNTEGAADVLHVNFDIDETEQFLAATASSAVTSTNFERVGALELFVAALVLAFRDADLQTDPLSPTSDESKPSSFVVDLEGHGRDDWQDLGCESPAVIPLQTIGWFTAMYPLEVPLPAQAVGPDGQQCGSMSTDLLDMLSASVSALNQLPDRKSLFGLQNLAKNTASHGCGRILLNYMGQFGARLPAKESVSSAASWRFVSDSEVDAAWSAPENRRSHDIIIDGKIVDGCLDFAISFCPLNDTSEILKTFAVSFKDYVLAVSKAIKSRRQFWARTYAALSDPAEIPTIPSQLPLSAGRDEVEKFGSEAEVWLDEKKLDAFAANMTSTCKNADIDAALSALYLETLRRWTSFTPERKSIAAMLQKMGSNSEIYDIIPLIQPIGHSSAVSAAMYFETVSDQLSFMTKTRRSSESMNQTALSSKTPFLCISIRAETYFSSRGSRHTTTSVISNHFTSCSNPSAVPVYCLHYAGGSAALFSATEWGPSSALSVVSVELPGHGSRRGEALLDSIDALAEDVIRSTGLGQNKKIGPFGLLGYSFGALVMHEVAQRLEKMGSPPAHLFVAAEAAPEDAVPAVDPVSFSLYETLSCLCSQYIMF